MSYFLRYDVDVTPNGLLYVRRAELRRQGAVALGGSEGRGPDLPDYITGGGVYGVEPGSQIVTVRVFGPVGGEIGDLDLNGAPMDLVRVDQDGRPVRSVAPIASWIPGERLIWLRP